MYDHGYVLSYDVGTTHIKAALVSLDEYRVGVKSVGDSVIEYPKPGWAEQDPEFLWGQLSSLTGELFDGSAINPGNVRAIVFSAHMAGVLPVDSSGNPLRRIIVWLDERGAGLPRELWSGLMRVKGYNLFRLLEFLRITGGAPGRTGKDPISKIIWVRDNEPDVYERTSKFLDVKGYLIYKATGEYVTSWDEANLLWLADTRSGRVKWHERLVRKYGLDLEMLPTIMKSTEIAGRLTRDAARDLGLPEGLPVVVGAGDMPAAAIGSGAVGEGEIHIYIGTSDWVAAHVSKRIVDVSNYIGSIASGIPGMYLLVAEQEIAAGALEWIMSLLGMDSNYALVEELVEDSEPGSSGILFMPWMYGERAPIDDPYIRGGFLNLSINSSKGDILRSVMEGVAFNIKWVYHRVEKLTRVNKEVNIVGGGSLFDEWCRIIASAIGRRVRRIMDPQDAVLRGSSVIAAKAIGHIDHISDAVAKFRVEREFEPEERLSKVYERLFRYYREAYNRLKSLYRGLNASHT